MKSSTIRLFVLLIFALVPTLASAYYDPVQGRWCSRDPIEEPGHLVAKYAATPGRIAPDPFDLIVIHAAVPSGTEDSLGSYAAMDNNTISRIDPFGEKWLECPAGKWRCWNGNLIEDWDRGGNGCSVPPIATGALEALGGDSATDPRRDRNGDNTFNNEPVIGVNFNTCGACRNHDRCMGACHPARDVFAEFWVCQSNFEKRLLECCDEGLQNGSIEKGRHGACRRIARAYAFATNHFGFAYYKRAQHDHCGECDDCPCKQPNEPPNWNKYHRPPYNG